MRILTIMATFFIKMVCDSDKKFYLAKENWER